MKIMELWPTKVACIEVPEDLCMEIYNQHVISSSKDWQQVLTTDNKLAIEQYANQAYQSRYQICDGWIRTLTTNGMNDFELHCDSHYGNQLVGVLQLIGDVGCGGDINLFDPAWRNPQWMSDIKNSNINKFAVPFAPRQLIIFPSDVWHSVSSYMGQTNRVTLNVMFRRVD